MLNRSNPQKKTNAQFAVCLWCQDWKGEYPSGPVRDSYIASSEKHRVARGGSWYNGAGDCRSANRGGGAPDFHNNNLGFRLVMSP
jgi:formylglycine-generating enzyme required for sulfatase activity